jgi:heterodisulfide reductase subunit C
MAEFAKQVSAQASRDSAWESRLLAFKDLKLLRRCMQCGTCSGSCGVAPLADYTPRMIVNLVARGDIEAALKSKMIFLCTNCLACTTRCPKGIPVADLMMKLRNMSIQAHLASAEDDASSREFVRTLLKRGRIYEPELMIRFAMKTSPLSLLGMRGQAISLFQKGKIGLPSKSGTDLSDLKKKFKEVG